MLEAKNLPEETDIENKSLLKDYDDFVEWWSNCNENEISNSETLLGAYQVMWFYNEVCNGGFDQFFDFAEKWDLNQTSKLFNKLLPKEFYNLFNEALIAYQNGEDCEKFNESFDNTKMEKEVLPKLASKVMKIVNKK